MSHNPFWLVDKKALNEMRNLKMACLLFKKIKANIYNRDRDSH